MRIKTILYLRLRLLFSNVRAMILFGMFVLLFFLCLLGLKNAGQEKSSIPISIVAKEEGTYIQSLIERLKKLPTFYCYVETEKEAKNRLKSGEVSAVFVIEEGYEKNIAKGRNKELITVYYLNGNETNRILSDVVAGEMLYDICLFESYNKYKEVANNPQVTWEEWEELSKNREREDSSLFQYQYSQNKEQTKEVESQVLYDQMVVGMIACLMMLFAFLFAGMGVADRESPVGKRLVVTTVTRTERIMGDFFFTFLLTSGLGILFTGLLFAFTKTSVSFAFFSITLWFSLLISILYQLLGMVFRSYKGYLAFGSALFLLFCALGFLGALGGLLTEKWNIFIKFIPNSWFISEIIDIMGA